MIFHRSHDETSWLLYVLYFALVADPATCCAIALDAVLDTVVINHMHEDALRLHRRQGLAALKKTQLMRLRINKSAYELATGSVRENKDAHCNFLLDQIMGYIRTRDIQDILDSHMIQFTNQFHELEIESHVEPQLKILLGTQRDWTTGVSLLLLMSHALGTGR